MKMGGFPIAPHTPFGWNTFNYDEWIKDNDAPSS